MTGNSNNNYTVPDDTLETRDTLVDSARRDVEIPHGIFSAHNIQRVVLFLGTSRDCLAYREHQESAKKLAARVAAWSSKQPAQRKLWVCSGGKEGIMGAASEGAVSEGGHALGFGYSLPGRPPNHYQDEKFTHQFSALGLRDYWLFSRAEAIVVFPGGLGTLMELFDALLHMQIGVRKKVPVFLFGSAFWRKVIDTDALLEQGVVSQHELEQIRYSDDIEDVVCALLT